MWSVWLIFFSFFNCDFHSVHPLTISIRGLWKFPDGKDWLWGKLGLIQMGGAMLNKSLIWFSVDGEGCIPSLLLDLRLNYGGVSEDNGSLLLKVLCIPAIFSDPELAAGHRQPTFLLETSGHSQVSLGQSLVGSLLLSSGSLVCTGFVCALQESVSAILCKFCNQFPLASKVKFFGGSQSLCQTPRLGNLLWVLELSWQGKNCTGLSSSHVWMWELDYKESWVLKNWCFWSVVLEKMFESPLDCREMKPVSLKGNKSWIFIERTNAEAETPILCLPDAKNWVIVKDPDAGRDWRQEEKRTTEDEMVG